MKSKKDDDYNFPNWYWLVGLVALIISGNVLAFYAFIIPSSSLALDGDENAQGQTENWWAINITQLIIVAFLFSTVVVVITWSIMKTIKTKKQAERILNRPN